MSAVAMGAIFFLAGGFAHASGRPAVVSVPILAGEGLIAIAREGWACMGFTLVMAAGLLAAILMVRRRSDATHPVALGTAVGAVSGAWADLVVDAWCPLTNAPHVLLGHITPIIVLVAAGALIGNRLLAIKASVG